MSAPWAELDDRGLRLYTRLHRMLLRLAGQLPDELISRARALLAEGDLAHLPDAVTIAAAEGGVPLTAAEVELLREVFTALGLDAEPAAAGEVTLTTTTPGTGHTFSPDSATPPRVPAGIDLSGGVPNELEDDLFDLTDQLVVDALSERPGVVAVRRAWRDDSPQPRRVFLVEVDPGVPAWEAALEGQTEAEQLGENDPRVEVYWSGDDLPPYHRAAIEAAALLWRR